MQIYKILFLSVFLFSALYAGETLKQGDTAPDFILKDGNGKVHKLSDYQGKIVALYFYPKDDTRGCTEQACNLRDNFSSLKDENIVILGISYDDSSSHAAFSEKYELPFPLLSDTEKTTAKAYGAYKEGSGVPARITALIDAEGKILHTITDVKTSSHSEQILAAVKKD